MKLKIHLYKLFIWRRSEIVVFNENVENVSPVIKNIKSILTLDGSFKLVVFFFLIGASLQLIIKNEIVDN
jgi:hypothetical protein